MFKYFFKCRKIISLLLKSVIHDKYDFHWQTTYKLKYLENFILELYLTFIVFTCLLCFRIQMTDCKNISLMLCYYISLFIFHLKTCSTYFFFSFHLHILLCTVEYIAIEIAQFTAANHSYYYQVFIYFNDLTCLINIKLTCNISPL